MLTDIQSPGDNSVEPVVVGQLYLTLQTTVTTGQRLSPCLQTTMSMSKWWMTVSCGHQLLPDSQEADTGSPDCVVVQRRQSGRGLHQHFPTVRTVLLHDIPRSGGEGGGQAACLSCL